MAFRDKPFLALRDEWPWLEWGALDNDLHWTDDDLAARIAIMEARESRLSASALPILCVRSGFSASAAVDATALPNMDAKSISSRAPSPPPPFSSSSSRREEWKDSLPATVARPSSDSLHWEGKFFDIRVAKKSFSIVTSSSSSAVAVATAAAAAGSAAFTPHSEHIVSSGTGERHLQGVRFSSTAVATSAPQSQKKELFLEYPMSCPAWHTRAQREQQPCSNG